MLPRFPSNASLPAFSRHLHSTSNTALTHQPHPLLKQDLNEEDLALKKDLEMCVERVRDPEAGVARLALETLRREIKTSTSSMTAVPKPLKFLRAHFASLVAAHDTVTDAENRSSLADVISVLAMTSE